MVFSFGFVILWFIQLTIITKSSAYSLKSLSNGCTAHECKRSCLDSNISPTPGDNGFKVIVEDAPDKRYMPNKDYKSKLHEFYLFIACRFIKLEDIKLKVNWL